MPDTREMFADVDSVEERASRLESLKKALADSISRHDSGEDGFISAREAAKAGPNARVGIIKGMGPGRRRAVSRLESLAERFAASQGDNALTKALSPDEQNAVNEELAALAELTKDLQKDITSTSPGNLHPYDLEAPAKVLVPRFTPLRNQIARQRGQGSAREYRRILGYTNAGVGGVADQTPFFNSESDASDPTFGTLQLRRGQKIAYAMDIHTANYMEMSLSDMVTWKAQFTNLGFEDSRQLSQMALLWAHLLGEEKAILWGRGASASGYEGAVAAPTIGVPTSAGSGTGSGFGTTVFVKVTSNTGQGQSAASGEQTSAVLTAGRPLQIPITVQPNGAINYGVYASTTTGTETFQGFFVPTSGNLVIPNFISGGVAAPGSDTSSNANGYDGYLSVLTDPNQAGSAVRFDLNYAGKSVYTAGGGSNVGDQPWQDAFASLFASIYADPEEIWLAAPQRRQLTDFLRTASGTAGAYRITLSEASEGSMTVGGMVTGIVNESSPTARVVDLRVHPYMPLGASFINSRVLPIPDSNIGETAVITAVQEYMAVDWPQIQFSYDASTYWYGTMVHYAPKWSASIVGLQ